MTRPRGEVGYCKPPKHTQFKPGRSGNPKGRPKGTQDLKTDLIQELSERIAITESGKSLRVSKQRLIVKSLTARAIKGDVRAASILINLLAQTMGLDPHEVTKVDLSAEDQAILTAWTARAKRIA